MAFLRNQGGLISIIGSIILIIVAYNIDILKWQWLLYAIGSLLLIFSIVNYYKQAKLKERKITSSNISFLLIILMGFVAFFLAR